MWHSYRRFLDLISACYSISFVELTNSWNIRNLVEQSGRL